MSKIPQQVIDNHKKGVEALTFYGYAVTDLDRDELLALANCLAQTLKEERERLLSTLEFYRSIRHA